MSKRVDRHKGRDGELSDDRITVDTVEFNQDAKGYQSTFHFEKNIQKDSNVIERAKIEIKHAILPICSSCKKIRNEDGTWQDLAGYFKTRFDAHFTHGICPACKEKLYPELFAPAPRTTARLVTGGAREQKGALASNILPALGGSQDTPAKGSEDRRSRHERRSGSDRRKRVQGPVIVDLGRGKDRRSGLDRRIASA